MSQRAVAPVQLLDETSSTCTYLLVDEATAGALLIDPVEEQLDRDLAMLRSRGLQLRWILETHVHADHITSAATIAQETGARVATPARCGALGPWLQLEDGDVLTFGSQRVTALHTPGHTAGSMCYLWDADGAGTSGPGGTHVFTGDTLLIGGCGRTDFQSGDAGALYDSITRKLFTLDDSAIVWPGHDYARRGHSTIGDERRSNARIAGRSREEFRALMASLDLPYPQRIEEAVPANLRLGMRG